MNCTSRLMPLATCLTLICILLVATESISQEAAPQNLVLATSPALAKSLALATARTGRPAPGHSEQPILLAQNNWSSQLVLSHIVGNALMTMGYTVNYIAIDAQLQFQVIAAGDLHFQVAAWEGPMKPAFDAAITQGMVDAGTHSATTREAWWIPDYVLEDCPQADHWRGLNACAELFATARTAPRGQFLAPPLDWGKEYSRRVAALQMDFDVVNVEHPSTLWARLQSAYANREPVVLFNWTPNFTDLMYQGRFVEFPEPVPECETDASWGPNPEATGDCGEPRGSWLKKAAWSGMAEQFPAAWDFVKNVDFTNAQIARAIQLVDIDGLSPESAAQLWAEENADSLRLWSGQ